LKAPGTKRVELQHDEPLSNFAFKLILRRYSMGDVVSLVERAQAGAYTRPLFSST
jgi:hypothetical protein